MRIGLKCLIDCSGCHDPILLSLQVPLENDSGSSDSIMILQQFSEISVWCQEPARATSKDELPLEEQVGRSRDGVACFLRRLAMPAMPLSCESLHKNSIGRLSGRKAFSSNRSSGFCRSRVD